MNEVYTDFEKIGQLDLSSNNIHRDMGIVNIYRRKIKRKSVKFADLERPLPEPETIGTWKGRKHSHIVLDGSTCQVLDTEQWIIIQEKIKELQDLIKVNIMASYFCIDGNLNKK